MRIQKLSISNYRSFRNEHITFDPLTSFVGRNSSGKSNVLHAIEFFYSLEVKLDPEDFHGRDSTNPIEVTLTFVGLSPREREEFGPYVVGDALVVKKVASLNDGVITQKYYASSLQHPLFGPIRQITQKREKTNAWNSLVDSNLLPGAGARVKNSDDIEPQMAAYEAAHPEALLPVESERQFFGPTNVGGGKLDNYTKFVMVPAVREAADEVTSKKGAVYQLLEMIVRRKVESRQDIVNFRNEFEERIRSLYSSDNLTELPELADEINRTLATYAPGASLRLDWEDPFLPALPLPNALARLEEGGFESDIRRKGHGLQRALILTLLQYLAGAKPFVPGADGVAEESQLPAESGQSSPDLILAIEEPELYQHPLRSRFLCEVLYELSQTWESGMTPRNQVIFTSHSPYFIALDRFDSIRRVRKSIAEGSDSAIEQSKVQSFRLADATRLAAANAEDARKFTVQGFLSRARPVMNSIVNEGFFADVVLVVEGNTEYALFWSLQEVLHKEWYRKGIAVVPAFGKNNLDRPVIIFRGFHIPTYFIFDADSDAKGKKAELETASRNKRYLKLAGVQAQDFPQTSVQSTWAVFEDRIEKTIEGELGRDVYSEICQKATETAGLATTADLIKNIEGAAVFLDSVYEAGKALPTLEAIVAHAEALRDPSQR